MKIHYEMLWIGYILNALTTVATNGIETDPNGYLVYCPCMGKMGNQADHLLGSMSFARGLNRTLILPPWNVYNQTENELIVTQVPYSDWFDPKPIQEYQKAITMEKFMQKLADKVWPENDRPAICPISREFGVDTEPNSCNAKYGKPFGPFWDNFNIHFTSSLFYYDHNLTVGSLSESEFNAWQTAYPSDKYPVLAFVGAPAMFPTRSEDLHLQQYVKYNEKLIAQRDAIIARDFDGKDYVAVHLRTGVDHQGACGLADRFPNLMSSPQCLGFNNEHGTLTKEICLPSMDTVKKHVQNALERTGLKFLYLATTDPSAADDLQREFRNVEVVWNEDTQPIHDLAILGASKYFIGNCVSSFTAFVVRERNVNNLKSSFFGMPIVNDHDEL